MVFTLSCSVSLLAVLTIVTADTFNVDLEQTVVCTQAVPQVVRKQDIYNIYAQPPQDGKGQRDRCTVKFVGENGAKFKLHLVDLVFGECQIFVKMYDGDMNLNFARYEFGCEATTGGLYFSHSSEIAISLEKADTYSTAYKFLVKLALVDGPDIGGSTGGEEPTDTMTAGAIAGVAVGGVLLLVIIVLVVIYCVVVFRRKQEEKELARSRTTLFPPSYSTKSATDGGSVHSSRHSTHSTHSTHASTHSTHASTHNTAQNYPAYRTRQSISDKQGHCASLDSKSYDSEGTDGSIASDQNPKLVKSVKREFESMRRGIIKQEMRKEMEKDDLRKQDRRRQEVEHADRQDRAESNRGLGRSDRRRRDVHSDDERDNGKNSLRARRPRERSHDETDNRSRKSSRSRHSPARSVESGHTSRYNSSYTDDRDRGRDRSGRHRSSSVGSQSRRNRGYSDRDTFSDDDRRRHYDDDDDDRGRRRHHYDDDDYDDRDRRHHSRRDGSNSRMRNGRSKSQSAGRRQR